MDSLIGGQQLAGDGAAGVDLRRGHGLGEDGLGGDAGRDILQASERMEEDIGDVLRNDGGVFGRVSDLGETWGVVDGFFRKGLAEGGQTGDNENGVGEVGDRRLMLPR